MSEVLFYHLTHGSLDTALPDILNKCRTNGWTVNVRCPDERQASWADDQLWVSPADSFLPHGRNNGATPDASGVSICIASVNEPLADVLVTLFGAAFAPSESVRAKRVMVIFDGNDIDAVNQARTQWKAVSASGVPAKYYSQETGRWAEKASVNIANVV
jgi:DNA polymerase-3 subunit chi